MNIVRTREDYCRALQSGKSSCITAPGMVGYAGVLYLRKMQEEAIKAVPGVPHCFFVDCGDDGALALSAMREGFTHIAFDRASPAYAKIKNIAAQQGVELLENA